MRNISKAATLASALLGAATIAAPASAGGLVQPRFDLADFSAPLAIDNRYWPLPAGRRIVYFEAGEDACKVNEFLVTHRTKQDFTGIYAGLQARVILDREWLDADCDGGRDRLLESTFDWHAQDDAGNVWYFGEDTVEFLYDDAGNPIGTSTAGSWEAGVDGAIAGLIMLAEPAPGLFYQQEFYAGVAEDRAKVIGVDQEVVIGLGDFSGCIVTKDTSPLSPGAIEHKHYCPDAGLVLIDHPGAKDAVEAVDLGL